MSLIMNTLVEHIRSAANYNEQAQVAPAAILWTDKEYQWQSSMPLLKQQLPELIELGEYNPDDVTARIGPAVWIKCAIAHLLPDLSLPEGKTPIIYLPGVTRKDLRAIELCEERLQPLAELQYRGCWWNTPNNNRDWSVSGFLSSEAVGIGLDIAKDAKTQEAMLWVLDAVLQETADNLQGRRLEADDFNRLIADDPRKDVLQWMDDPAVVQHWEANKQKVFASFCQDQLGLSPEIDQWEQFALALCEQQGAWAGVWSRFCDVALQLPNLLTLLETVRPMGLALEPSSYLSINSEDEVSLADDMEALPGLSPMEARKKITALYEQHQTRKEWLWASIGLSPYLAMLIALKQVADYTEISFSGPDAMAMANSYENKYWQADAGACKAFALAEDDTQRALMADILAGIYSPWLRDVAVNFQSLVKAQGYPGAEDMGRKSATAAYADASQVVFFVDGLRFDVAQQLQARIAELIDMCDVGLSSHWSALPSLTATAKAAVTPVHGQLTGLQNNDTFEPVIGEGDKPFTSHHFKKALEEAGWEYLDGIETGDAQGKAWIQTGDIDKTGHKEKLKLPTRIDDILADVVARVVGLLEAGWQNIRIVTDHGWLWVPDQMPKAEISKDAARNRLVRCAILKDNVSTEHVKVHWHWNANVTIAMAPDISGFTAGLYYDHGGLSLQECLTPVLNITAK